MEKDCAISHGASRFLKERLFDTSDAYSIKVCQDCGHKTVISGTCNMCKSTNVGEMIIPYPTKLLDQQLESLCIKTVPTLE